MPFWRASTHGWPVVRCPCSGASATAAASARDALGAESGAADRSWNVALRHTPCASGTDQRTLSWRARYGTLSLGSLRRSTRLMGVVTARSAGRIRALAGPLSASAPHEQCGRCRRDIEIRVPSARAAEPHRLELQTNDQSRGVDV